MKGTLHNCLIAVANRYPDYVIHVNEDVWKYQDMTFHGKTALDIVEYLHAHAPEFLYVSAVLDFYIDEKCEIYVLDLSPHTPAFRLHHPRKSPAH